MTRPYQKGATPRTARYLVAALTSLALCGITGCFVAKPGSQAAKVAPRGEATVPELKPTAFDIYAATADGWSADAASPLAAEAHYVSSPQGMRFTLRHFRLVDPPSHAAPSPWVRLDADVSAFGAPVRREFRGMYGKLIHAQPSSVR